VAEQKNLKHAAGKRMMEGEYTARIAGRKRRAAAAAIRPYSLKVVPAAFASESPRFAFLLQLVRPYEIRSRKYKK
jgi:hypothetical protein